MAPHSPGLRLQIPNPFDPADRTEADEAMPTWIGYFKQAKAPSHVDYASVDEAMKKLRMKTTWPEQESRIMSLQADLETVLDQFNLTELAFEHEQRRIVRYLASALAPVSFKSVILTKLTLQENKRYKNEVVPFCSWVTQLKQEFITWEPAAQAASPPDPASQSQQPRGSGRGLPVAPVAAGIDPKLARGACLKCNSADHQVRDCPRCQPGEATQPLKARREQRDAARNMGVRRFDVVDADRHYSKANGVDVDNGTVDAKVDGVAVVAILLEPGADTFLVARGVLDALEQAGKSVSVSSVDEVQLNPVGGQSIDVSRQATFEEVVITTSAGPLNLTCYVEEENDSKDLTVGRPIMRIIGYSTDKLLVKAREVNSEWELSPAELESDNHGEAPTALQRVYRIQAATRDPPEVEADADIIERHEMRAALPSMQPTPLSDVTRFLEKKVVLAKKMGLTLDGGAKLAAIVSVSRECESRLFSG
ncbi:unnamed protein product [Phytophthora fragariaefolia]|uniref:Unnamed protein product n=1 Tax=Phytophthora fragariaefolia TaxID=1490495 RepID=A0A9W6WYM9_9STRA|nr:unnamed protein product [Phytophthora fragariaefolia]